MDMLKVFNLIVCADKITGEDKITSGWLFNILFAPLAILFPFSKFSILAYFTIFIFFVLIYSTQSKIFSLFNTDIHGKKSILNSMFSAFLLYVFQTTIILLFLRYNICTKTLDWQANDYHLTLQHYSNAHESATINNTGY